MRRQSTRARSRASKFAGAVLCLRTFHRTRKVPPGPPPAVPASEIPPVRAPAALRVHDADRTRIAHFSRVLLILLCAICVRADNPPPAAYFNDFEKVAVGNPPEDL